MAVIVLVVVAVGLVFLGYLAGLRSSWSGHQPTTVNVTVERVRMDVPYALFMHDGRQVGFRLDDIAWRTDNNSDSGTIPPCLRVPGEPAKVELGMIEVNRPWGSGSYWKVLSLTCPAGDGT